MTIEMNLSSVHVLIVDDEVDLRRGLEKLVGSIGVRTFTADSGESAMLILEVSTIDIIISDIKMNGMSGVDLLKRVMHTWPSISVILLTGFGTIEMAVECLQLGAAHFLTKPFDNNDIIQLVQRIGRSVVARKSETSDIAQREHGIIAEDRLMKLVFERAQQVACTTVPVLISGESGTGKELVARFIHAHSDAKEKPFLAVNCAALPDALLESELFGYKKSAFTGASKDHDGIFTQVSGGTVFFDELPSMSLAFQGKLLRVLQEKVIRPLGAMKDEPVEFRILSATNKNLLEKVKCGEFREDLYYRLGVFTIEIPPLRERKNDITPLAEFFLQRAADSYLSPETAKPFLSAAALDELRVYSWPGNVRELQNAMQRALIISQGNQIFPHHIFLTGNESRELSSQAETLSYEEAKQAVVERFQRQFLLRVLDMTHGNVTQAADACGLTRVAVQKMMRRLNIERDDFAGI